MATFSEQLTQRLINALGALGDDTLQQGSAPVVTAATDTRFGDYQTNVAMTLAKPLKKNPRELASQIIEHFDVSGLCDPPEIAGPGFINFRICSDAITSRIYSLTGDERLGVDPTATTKRLLIDFSSPNVAKPMHIGHIRSTIIGDCLARTARFLGHDVIADNHIGDWGTPMGQVLYGWKNHLDENDFTSNPINELLRLYQLVKQQSESDPEIAGECLEETVKLQSGDPENLALWKQFIWTFTSTPRSGNHFMTNIWHHWLKIFLPRASHGKVMVLSASSPVTNLTRRKTRFWCSETVSGCLPLA